MANVGFDPTVANHASAEYTVGQLYFGIDGKIYRYVQFKDAVTYVAGHVLQWADATMTSVTNDIAGGSAITGGRAAGICMRVMTQDYYGFMLVSGYYAAVVTNGDDDIAAGDSLIPGAADGVCDSVAAATTTVHTKALGYALAADVDAANTVAAMVMCL